MLAMTRTALPLLSLVPDDPLWDGIDCLTEEASCCTHPNLPWFNKTLSKTIGITVRDGKLKFPLNQNVLRDVTSRWSMSITACSSDY